MRRFSPLVLIAVLVLAGCGNDAPATAQQAGAAATETPGPTPEPTPEITPTPSPSDYELRVKTLQKECFGSAGCNVSYTIRVTYSGTPLPEDATYSVTYKVTGGEDEVINTFEINGDRATVAEEESVSTSSSGAKLRAKVTEVELA